MPQPRARRREGSLPARSPARRGESALWCGRGHPQHPGAVSGRRLTDATDPFGGTNPSATGWETAGARTITSTRADNSTSSARSGSSGDEAAPRPRTRVVVELRVAPLTAELHEGVAVPGSPPKPFLYRIKLVDILGCQAPHKGAGGCVSGPILGHYPGASAPPLLRDSATCSPSRAPLPSSLPLLGPWPDASSCARFPSRPGPCQNPPTAGSPADHRATPYSPSRPNSRFEPLKRASNPLSATAT